MNPIRFIKTSGSSHHKCFVCLKNASEKNRLKTVRFDSIIKGYYEYHIFIKRSSRCCKNHLKTDGNLIDESFDLIPTKLVENKHQFFEMLDSQKLTESTVFTYICTCLSGKKVAGCCSHVATLIYYFAYAKYHANKYPAEFLNKILIDMERKDSPNKPVVVRN
ncbi:unnamed protein product [Brachionus calyciflorus]|uniref:SWIM-type domain-containing protein n=1 Tax=Brachionus calyciflorus TaxID=104777 RepID=A0A814FGT8_9BILA|nr:unnamed protein product [Brachionus calyciflorus]